MLSSAFPDSGSQKTLRMQKEYEVQKFLNKANFIEIFVIYSRPIICIFGCQPYYYYF